MVGWVCKGGREGGWTGAYTVSVPGQVFSISSVCMYKWVGGRRVKDESCSVN